MQTKGSRADNPAAQLLPLFSVRGLSAEKLSPLLRLRNNNAIADAEADLHSADYIRTVFVGFQKYLYSAGSNL